MGCLSDTAITSDASLVVQPNMGMYPFTQPILLHGRWTSGVVEDEREHSVVRHLTKKMLVSLKHLTIIVEGLTAVHCC